MAASCSNIIFLDFQKLYFLPFKHTTHNKTKNLGNQKHCLEHHQEWNLPKTLHNFSFLHNLHNFNNFTGVLLFLLIYVYFTLLLKVIHGCSWPENIVASPFKATHAWRNCLRSERTISRGTITPPSLCEDKMTWRAGFCFSFFLCFCNFSGLVFSLKFGCDVNVYRQHFSMFGKVFPLWILHKYIMHCLQAQQHTYKCM